MLRPLLAIFLAALLAAPALPAREPLATLNNIPPDTLVELRLHSGEKVRGWLAAVDPHSVRLRLGREKLETRDIAAGEVKAVKRIKTAESHHTGRNIAIGVGIAVGMIAIGCLIAASKLDYI